MMYLVSIPTMIYVRTGSHTLNTIRFLVSDMSKEHGLPITKIKKITPIGGSYRLLTTS